MLLAVDIGNTNVVLGGMEDGQVRCRARIPTEAALDTSRFSAEADRAVQNWDGALEACVVCSVVPRAVEAVETWARRVTGTPALVVRSGLKTGLSMEADHPEQVGCDRIAAVAGALSRYRPPLIVVDMGTATTLEAVAPENRYLGGLILPGVRLSLDALSAHAAQLPPVDLSAPPTVIGRNTADCMRGGALYGAAAAIDGLADRMEAELGGGAAVVATGGLSPLVVPLCRRKIALEPDLLLWGLERLYRENTEN